MPPTDMNEDLEDILSDMNISSRTETPKKDAEKKKKKDKDGDKEKEKGSEKTGESDQGHGKGPRPNKPLAGTGKAKEPIPETIFIGAPDKEDDAGKVDTAPLDLTGVAKRPGSGAAKMPTPLEFLEEGDVDQSAVDQNSILFYIQDLEEDLQEKGEALRREMERSGELQGKLEALNMELEQAKLDTLEARPLPGPGSSAGTDEAFEEVLPGMDGGDEPADGAPKLKADEAMQKYIASLEDKIRERSEELETEKLERIRISNEQQVLKEELEKVRRSQAASSTEGAGAGTEAEAGTEAGTGTQEGKPEASGFDIDTLSIELARLKTAVASRDKELHEWKGRVDTAEERANKLALELTNCGPEVLGEAMRGAVERMTELETQLRATTNELDLQRREKDEMLREIETLRTSMGTAPSGPMGTEAAETRDTSFKMAGKKAREDAREDAKVEEEGTEAGGKGEVEGKDDGTGAVAGADGVEAEERYEWPVRGHDMELIKTIIPTADEVPREKDGRKEGATRLMSDYLEARGAVRGERTGVIAPGTRPRGTMVYRCECGSKVMVHGNIDGDKYEDWARCPKCGKKVG